MLINISACLMILLALSGLSAYMYHSGYESATDYYKQQLTQAEIDNANAIVEQERLMRKHQDTIVAEYVTEIENLKGRYEQDTKELANAKLSNTTNCVSDTNKGSTRVPETNRNKSNLVCYTISDIHAKIKESVDITRECDELALKYNTLLRVCTTTNDNAKTTH